MPNGSEPRLVCPPSGKAAGRLRSASVLMAPLGVKAAHSMPVKPLKRVFAYTLFALAAYMFYKGFQG